MWSVHDLQTALEDALRHGWPTPHLPQATYLDLLERGDESCPGGNQLDGTDPRGCTAVSGVHFAGLSTWFEETSADEDTTHFSWNLTADFAITTPEGQVFEGGGSAQAAGVIDAGSNSASWTGRLEGSWRLTGGDGWLEGGVSTVADIEVGQNAQGTRVLVDGGVTVHSVALDADSLVLDPAVGSHPQGTLSVRDPGGGWWAVVFQDPSSACGQVSWQNQKAGEICPDLAGALLAAAEEGP
jgi:hypothetical protein